MTMTKQFAPGQEVLLNGALQKLMNDILGDDVSRFSAKGKSALRATLRGALDRLDSKAVTK